MVERADVPRLIDALLEFPTCHRSRRRPSSRSRPGPRRPTPGIRVKQQANSPSYSAAVSFVYGDRTVAPHERRSGWCDEATATIMRRDPGAEASALTRLAELGFRPEEWRPNRDDLKISGKCLPAALRSLMADGWRVEAEGKLIRPASEFKLAVTTGIDWFELDGGLDFGGQNVALPRLLAAARQGERRSCSATARWGCSPRTGSRSTASSPDLGAENGDHVRFAHGQAGLLDALLAAQPEIADRRGLREASRQPLRGPSRASSRGEPRGLPRRAPAVSARGPRLARLPPRSSASAAPRRRHGPGQDRPGPRPALAGGASAARAGRWSSCPRSLVFNWMPGGRRVHPPAPRPRPHRPGPTPARRRISRARLVIVDLRHPPPRHRRSPQLEFDYVILDEAQAIKNRRHRRRQGRAPAQGEHRLALSRHADREPPGRALVALRVPQPRPARHRRRLRRARRRRGDPGRATRDAPAPRRSGRSSSAAPRSRSSRTSRQDRADHLCDLEAAQRKLYEELRAHYRGALLGKHRARRPGPREDPGPRGAPAAAPGRLPSRPDRPEARRRVRRQARLLLDRSSARSSAEGHKALVFSQFTSFLAIVRQPRRRRDQLRVPRRPDPRPRSARVERFQTTPTARSS